MRQIALTAALLSLVVGCATGSPPQTAGTNEPESLTVVVAQLKLHMRDDTYRFDRAVDAEGNNVYAVALWKLDRLAEERGRAADDWRNADYVIEFARGKALERLRRYDDALHAFRRVESSGSVLGDAAAVRAAIIERFASASAVPETPFASAEEEMQFIQDRIASWRELAYSQRDTPQEPLAREEVEAWETMRVDGLLRSGRLDEAIRACRSLVESNRESKRFAKHLLRLGDLYADAAQREQLRARTHFARFDAERYDALVDQAFSAYELAGEDHKAALRREARTRIEALLAYHEGVRGHVP